ncbi:MAG TPA: nitroreductase family protein [Steroidobacteraceae bacterium]|nr:nitroreductase family protein [Steroidobacteraceae bacterium]
MDMDLRKALYERRAVREYADRAVDHQVIDRLIAAAAGPWCIEDCALAAQNLMLAACGEGLGSCWIGFAQAYLNTPAGKALLRLPPACVPVAPLIVGFGKGPVQSVPRNKPDVTWLG